MKSIEYFVFDLEGTLVETSYQEIICLPEIKRLLADLDANGKSLYLWTMRDRKSSLEILKQTGLISYFTDFCCLGSDSYAYKPDPEGIISMLPDDFNSEEVLVVGDSYKDMQAGKRLKSHTLCAGWYSAPNKEMVQRLECLGVDQVLTIPPGIDDLKLFHSRA
ncbi:HAD-IA family hydrolase [Bacteriovoracaceae bacterium]|nr:HAD-IA family hydrolase [Bacteriovoracaceae bacterium]